jgi:hypothetical protein
METIRLRGAGMNTTDSSFFRVHRAESDSWTKETSTGSRRWGGIDFHNPAWGGQSGWAHYGLVVLPPGTSSNERLALVRWHRWLRWGTLGGFVLAILLSTAMVAPAGFALIATAYVVVTMIGATRSRRLRAGIRHLEVTVVVIGGAVEAFGDAQLFKSSVEALDELDAQQRSGEIGPLEYELEWAKVYDLIGG